MEDFGMKKLLFLMGTKTKNNRKRKRYMYNKYLNFKVQINKPFFKVAQNSKYKFKMEG